MRAHSSGAHHGRRGGHAAEVLRAAHWVCHHGRCRATLSAGRRPHVPARPSAGLGVAVIAGGGGGGAGGTPWKSSFVCCLAAPGAGAAIASLARRDSCATASSNLSSRTQTSSIYAQQQHAHGERPAPSGQPRAFCAIFSVFSYTVRCSFSKPSSTFSMAARVHVRAQPARLRCVGQRTYVQADEAQPRSQAPLGARPSRL